MTFVLTFVVFPLPPFQRAACQTVPPSLAQHLDLSTTAPEHPSFRHLFFFFFSHFPFFPSSPSQPSSLGSKTFKIKMTDHTHRNTKLCCLFPFLPQKKEKEEEDDAIISKRKLFRWLRAWWPGLASIKAVVLSHVSGVLGCRMFGRWAGGRRESVAHVVWMGCIIMYSWLLSRFIFILFALANFLCVAAVPLNQVLTGCV